MRPRPDALERPGGRGKDQAACSRIFCHQRGGCRSAARPRPLNALPALAAGRDTAEIRSHPPLRGDNFLSEERSAEGCRRRGPGRTPRQRARGRFAPSPDPRCMTPAMFSRPSTSNSRNAVLTLTKPYRGGRPGQVSRNRALRALGFPRPQCRASIAQIPGKVPDPRRLARPHATSTISTLRLSPSSPILLSCSRRRGPVRRRQTSDARGDIAAYARQNAGRVAGTRSGFPRAGASSLW